MRQGFLKPEEPEKTEAERLPQQESVSEAEPEAALEVVNVLEPDGVVTPVTRWPHGQPSSVEKGLHANLRGMEPHEREELLEQLTRQAREQKKRRRWSQIVYTIGVSLFIGFNLAYVFGRVEYAPFITLPLALCYLVAGLCVNRAAKQWSRAATSMALFDDLRATGPLMEALDLTDPAVVEATEKALVRLLPRLRASDADSITEAQRACLYRRLKIQNAQKEAEFLIAALKALEQIGDGKAVPCVAALAANTDSWTKSPARVREAAQHCLPFLQARAEQQQSRDSLLRASSGLAAPSEGLLRPATGSAATDPHSLLRSSAPES